MTMAAVSTFGAADPSRRSAGIGLRLFRETGFHQKTTLVAHPLYSSVARRITLSRASNASKAMLALLFHPSVSSDWSPGGLLILMNTPIRRQFLSNIKHSRKELFSSS
jgi:hypothetical protein